MTLSIDIKNNIIPIDKERLVTIFPATEDDYWALSNEDLKVEFARGRIYIHSPASLAHEELVLFLLRFLRRYTENHPGIRVIGSRFALKLPNGHRPEPDLVLINEKLLTPAMTVFEGIPSMVIEVFSPGTKDFNLTEKLEWYQSAGIPEIFFIDAISQVVYYYRKVGKKYIEQQEKSGTFKFQLFPDVEIKIDWFWMEHLPALKDLPQ